MAEHARIMPPSSAARRIACPGSAVLEAALPDTFNDASDDGTAMHAVAAWCLTTEKRDAVAFVGRMIEVNNAGQAPRTVEFDEDMAELVQGYVDTIREMAHGHELLVEQRVDFSRYIDLADQFGTADAIIVRGDGELQVHDLKTGYHRVDVRRNPQLLLYALGAYDAHSLANDITSVRVFIHQPKIADTPSEWACSVEELMAFAEEARRATHACKAAQHCMDGGAAEFAEKYLRPGDEQCHFCKAAATCPALRERVAGSVGDFDVIEQPAAPLPVQGVHDEAAVRGYSAAHLGLAMRAAPLVEVWLKAVRAETERRLLAGQVVDGFKLVQGKRGARRWADPEAAEAALKTFRLKVEEMYSLKVISPTAAEKLTKAKDGEKPLIGPRQWPKLQALVTQSDGKPSVAPADDKRPALEMKPPADDFEVVDAGATVECELA